MARRTVGLTLTALLFLSGCSTAAQQQAQQAEAVYVSAAAEMRACASVRLTQPQYAELLAHTANVEFQHSTAQLTDERFATPQEASLYSKRFEEIVRCRTKFVNSISSVRPDLVPLSVKTMTQDNLASIELIEGRITWGEYARREQTRVAEFRTNWTAANRPWTAERSAQRELEPAQRQAAAIALAQWAEQQAVIDSLSRKVHAEAMSHPVRSPPASDVTPVGAEPALATSHRYTVPLTRRGGTFSVPVMINNTITLNFIIDTGASDVSVPADVVLTLMRAGTIRSSDFVGTARYRLADGSVVPSAMFRIHELRIGDATLDNVTASVASVSGPLLLGQSFLSRFTSWSIDNRRQVLLLN